MTFLRAWGVLRLRSLFGKRQIEGELERELRFHLDQRVAENMAGGMTPDDARVAAVRRLGGAVQIQEECRDMRRTQTIETTWNDLRYALRMLKRNSKAAKPGNAMRRLPASNL